MLHRQIYAIYPYSIHIEDVNTDFTMVIWHTPQRVKDEHNITVATNLDLFIG